MPVCEVCQQPRVVQSGVSMCVPDSDDWGGRGVLELLPDGRLERPHAVDVESLVPLILLLLLLLLL